jgi:hypothetical protein
VSLVPAAWDRDRTAGRVRICPMSRARPVAMATGGRSSGVHPNPGPPAGESAAEIAFASRRPAVDHSATRATRHGKLRDSRHWVPRQSAPPTAVARRRGVRRRPATTKPLVDGLIHGNMRRIRAPQQRLVQPLSGMPRRPPAESTHRVHLAIYRHNQGGRVRFRQEA